MTMDEHLRMSQRVLIVDDHPSFREMARALLEAEGFDVVGESVDGESAIAAARQLSPDLVLLDIQLPGMDGFEVARRIADAQNPPVVILVSSRAAWEYGSLVDKAPARAFIGKSELSAARLLTAIGDRS